MAEITLRALCESARETFNNREIKAKDLRWSGAEFLAEPGESLAFCANLRVWVAVKQELDKRELAPPRERDRRKPKA